MNRLLFVVAALSVLAQGCKPVTDLNSRCTLVKRNPDGGAPVPVREGEVRELQAQNKDFIALGSIDCEDLVCVRDSEFPVPDGGFDPAADALGYCSKRCLPGDACPSGVPAEDTDAKKRLICRPLLLDAETLALLCNGSPEDKAKCKAYFGNTSKPDFCARGGVIPDAGI